MLHMVQVHPHAHTHAHTHTHTHTHMLAEGNSFLSVSGEYTHTRLFQVNTRTHPPTHTYRVYAWSWKPTRKNLGDSHAGSKRCWALWWTSTTLRTRPQLATEREREREREKTSVEAADVRRKAMSVLPWVR
jgi:hypothetical protein